MKVVTFIPKGVQKADLPRFFSDVKPVIAKSLKKEMLRTRGVRWFTVSTIEFLEQLLQKSKEKKLPLLRLTLAVPPKSYCLDTMMKTLIKQSMMLFTTCTLILTTSKIFKEVVGN